MQLTPEDQELQRRNLLAIGKTIADLFPAFPSTRIDDEARAIQGYVRILGRYHADDVSGACDRLVRSGTSFMPSASDIVLEIEADAERQYRKTKPRAKVVSLPPPEWPEEHREAMKANFRALLEDIKSKAEKDASEPSARRVAAEFARSAPGLAIAAGKHDPRPTPKLSQEALSKLGGVVGT